MLEVGQELWYVPADSRYVDRSKFVKVTKLGRKWVALDHEGYRIDPETLWVDGGQYSSPGRCWPSKEAWEVEVRRARAWADFVRWLPMHQPPDGVNVEMIETIKRILGVPGQSTTEPK